MPCGGSRGPRARSSRPWDSRRTGRPPSAPRRPGLLPTDPGQLVGRNASARREGDESGPLDVLGRKRDAIAEEVEVLPPTPFGRRLVDEGGELLDRHVLARSA